LDKFNVLIVDDEPNCNYILKSHLNNYTDIENIYEFTDSRAALNYLEENPVDLVFLDIDMPNMNGLTLTKELKNKYPEISVVFVTGHTDYALYGYELYPLDFLIKPINPLRLEQCLTHFRKIHTNPKVSGSVERNTSGKKISVRSSGSICFINVKDINFIEKRIRKCVINTGDNKEIECNHTLSELEKMLGRHGFIRPHQSFLIPLDKISEIKPDEFMKSYVIEIENVKDEIRVSKNRYKELKEIILETL
jgi:two-component system, LytTR family, response regulator